MDLNGYKWVKVGMKVHIYLGDIFESAVTVYKMEQTNQGDWRVYHSGNLSRYWCIEEDVDGWHARPIKSRWI